jgi:hypothetical protein
MTPEEIRQYNIQYCRKWYSEHKDEILKKIMTPVVCECGFETAQCNLKRHQKTKLHLKKLSARLSSQQITQTP